MVDLSNLHTGSTTSPSVLALKTLMFAQRKEDHFLKWLVEYVVSDADLLRRLPIKHCSLQHHMGRQARREKVSLASLAASA